MKPLQAFERCFAPEGFFDTPSLKGFTFVNMRIRMLTD